MTRLPRSRRLVLASAALVVGLSACGAQPVAERPAASPPVIQIAGATGIGTAGASLDAAPSAESSKMMVAYMKFVYGGDVVDLTAPASAWSFRPGPVPTDAQISSLASALGIEGAVRPLAADMGGGWAVGSEDYTAPSVNVSADAMESWWYNPGATTTSSVGSCELFPAGDPAGGSTDATAPVCSEPAPPTGVPSAGEAEAKARALFEQLGVDLSNYQFESNADDWGAYVTGFLVLDGVRTTVSIGAGYGAEGALQWANGFLAAPQREADYPLIGIDAAVQRLNDQQGMWSPMERSAMDSTTGVAIGSGVASAGMAEPALGVPSVAPECPANTECPVDTIAVDDTAVHPTPNDVTPAPTPTDGVIVDPAPLETMPVDTAPIEPIVVTLTNPQLSLQQVWSADGTIWLLPGYAFDSDDGAGGVMKGVYTVIAVEDQFLQYTDVPVEQPVAVDPVPVDSTPVDSLDPSGTETAVACAPIPTEITMAPANGTPILADGDLFVGMCETDVHDFASKLGFEVRVVRIDGQDQAATDDFRDHRFNVAVVAGVVTEVISIG